MRVLDASGNECLTYAKANDIIQQGEKYIREGIAECVLSSTEILAGLDGNTKLAMDMKQGDSIVYYNFKTNKCEACMRHLKRNIVQGL